MDFPLHVCVCPFSMASHYPLPCCTTSNLRPVRLAFNILGGWALVVVVTLICNWTGNLRRTQQRTEAQSTYIDRVQSSVWRLPNYWPPTPLSTQRVCPPPAPKTGRWGGGGSIFWKTPDIGLVSYSIIPLRTGRGTAFIPVTNHMWPWNSDKELIKFFYKPS